MIGYTGLGSLSGLDFDGALRFVFDCPFPWLPELPDRGPAASMVSRGLAVLPFDWSGQKEARALLRDDLDRLEEFAYDYVGPLKVGVCGPWTLAATAELPRGQRVLSDPGATRDLCDGLAHGVLDHLAEVRRRVPGAELYVQCDEPALPFVQRGEVRTAGGLFRYPAVDEELVAGKLRPFAEFRHSIIHCCAGGLDVRLVTGREVGFSSVSLPFALLAASDLEVLLDRGCGLFLGGSNSMELPRPQVLAERVLTLLDRAGGVPKSLVVTPDCGIPDRSVAETKALFEWLASVAAEVGERLDGPRH